MGYLHWQGRLAAGKKIEQLVNHYDLLPTLCELAGSKPRAPEHLAGNSIVPLLAGNTENWPDRLRVFHNGRWKSAEGPEGRKGEFSVRNEQFRLVGGQLYDLAKDPGETQDISKEHPEVVATLRAHFENWWTRMLPLMINENARSETPIEATWHLLHRQQTESEGFPEWQPPSGYVPQSQ